VLEREVDREERDRNRHIKSEKDEGLKTRGGRERDKEQDNEIERQTDR
jgi:hypothetical protein